MKIYKYPKWLRRFYPGSIWGIFHTDNTLYLTFDDGPSIHNTSWILQVLKQYNAKATFFCLGKNSVEYPHLMNDMIAAGHLIGNHGMQHLNGLKTNTSTYVNDVETAAKHTSSKLFRPPYGKLKIKQFNQLKKAGYKTVFWSFLKN